MSTESERPPSEVRIVSAIPGRVRLKLSGSRGALDELKRIADELTDRMPGALAEANLRARSVLVRYDVQALGADAVDAALRDLGVAVASRPPAAAALPAAVRLADAAGRLDAGVRRATGGTDLRGLVPVGLAVLALRQAFSDAPGLRQAPWYVLAWYAYEASPRLGVTSPSPTAPHAGSEPGEPSP